MATVTELITETQGLLKKSAKVTAAADDCLRWFNELQRRLQRKAKIRDIWTLTAVNGTASYSLTLASYPILNLAAVYYTATNSTDKVEVDILSLADPISKGVRLKEARGTGTTQTLYVNPSTLAGTLELHGLVRLSTLTSSPDSTPEIPIDFHDLYPLWAAARFGGQDEDFGGDGRFANFMQDFLRREAEFFATMRGANGRPRFFQQDRRW
jgi:hypothetical protein